MMPSAAEKVPLRVQAAVYGVGAFANSGTVLVWVVIPLWLLHLETSPFFVGLAIGIRSLLPLLLAMPCGALMDRLGSRRVVLVFSAIGVVLPPLYPLLPWIPAVIALQAFAGLANVMGWIGAQALIGQLMNSSPVYASRLSLSLRMAILTGPMLVGLAWDLYGPWGGFGMLWLWGVLQFAAAVCLPKADPALEGAAGPLTRVDLMPRFSDYGASIRLMAIPIVAMVVAISTIRMSGSAIQGSFLVVYLQDIGISATLIGVLLSSAQLFGATGVLTSSGTVRILRDHWVLLLSSGMAVAAVTVTPLLTSFWALMVSTAFRGIGSGISQPLMISIGQGAAGRENFGKMAALRTSVNRLAEATIPIVMGTVVELAGLRASFLIVGGFLLLMLGVVGLLILRYPAMGGDVPADREIHHA